MKITVYNQEGIESGQMTLPKEIFEVKPNTDLINEVVVSSLSNRRQVSAKAKGRGEVSGGGKKPWRQKGTGRARQGSIRSPLWKGGGVTFAPATDRNFKKKINKKVGHSALKMLLSYQASNNNLIVVDQLSVKDKKTKLFVEIAKAMIGVFDKNKKVANRNLLFVLDSSNEMIRLAARNIEKIKITTAMEMNVIDLVSSNSVIFEEKAVKTISDRLVK
ncbi:MAG: 50S ribosomal protein L4 [bacterium]